MTPCDERGIQFGAGDPAVDLDRVPRLQLSPNLGRARRRGTHIRALVFGKSMPQCGIHVSASDAHQSSADGKGGTSQDGMQEHPAMHVAGDFAVCPLDGTWHRSARPWLSPDRRTTCSRRRCMTARSSAARPVLVCLAGAFDLSLGGLIARAEADAQRLVRSADQSVWRDPSSG
jgi:hypothetical protein